MKKRTSSFSKRGSSPRGGKPASFASRKPKARFEKATPGAKWKLAKSEPRSRIPVSAAFVKKTRAAKLVAALHDKKDREARKLFLVEGETSILEALDSNYEVNTIFATHEFLENYPEISKQLGPKVEIVDAQELTTLGTLARNTAAIGIFHQKELGDVTIGNEIVIALSGVNDPGNLGTIMRIADWYGIRKIIASNDTVDVYNPKTISATKGSFTRVDVYYCDLEDFLLASNNIPVIAADMRGRDAHKFPFPERGILLLGNEAHGIPDELAKLATDTVTIPRFGGAESLNVAIAGAVILDNWKR
ncbi:MAG: tRNA/rRNA methyltransferase SpoU [Patescibacteria group bacterium]|nr:tRNA/rRNA methyltransferase SpoU [Patescibacteria group bacterium]